MMEELREMLNNLVENEKKSLCNDEIIKISQMLDKFIVGYYLKENNNVFE